MPTIRLVTPDADLLAAALRDDAEVGHLLGGPVAPGWRDEFPGALERTRAMLARDPGGSRWGTRLFVADDRLVGWGGFKGPPRDGTVELGYEIAPGERGRGLATAAVAAMLTEAFAEPGINAVIAHTLAEPNASVRVLEKAGFERDGESAEPEVGTIWRWRLVRPG